MLELLWSDKSGSRKTCKTVAISLILVVSLIGNSLIGSITSRCSGK